MLSDVVGVLRCPVCSGGLRMADRALRCGAGHAFDIARQGYVNLLGGGAATRTADSAAMVQARAEFLDAGHYAPLASVLADGLADELAGAQAEGRTAGTRPVIVDAGAGTGYYLAAALDRCATGAGLALDASKFAARRAAKAHPAIGAAVCDLWQPLPVASGSIHAVLNVFAPRNGAEFRRVLRPDGVLAVVTPTRDHLAELGRLGMLTVDEHKEDRLERTFGEHFRLDRRDELSFPLTLTPPEVRQIIGMGPSAWHVDERTLDGVLDPINTTASFAISWYRRNGS